MSAQSVVSENNIRVISVENKKWYMANDIAHKLKLDKKTILKKLNSIEKRHKRQFTIKTNGGVQKCNFVDFNGFKIIICKSRSYSCSDLAKTYGININNEYIIDNETKTLMMINKSFKNIKMIREYKIGKYRVDAYMPKYKIAIECDENNHRNYDNDKEREREEYIKNELDCSFVRYNPTEPNFDIFELINQIFVLIHDSN